MAKDRAITPKDLKKRKPGEWDRWAPKMKEALLLVQSVKDDGFDIISLFSFGKHLYQESENPTKFEWSRPEPSQWKWFTILTYRPRE